MAMPDRNHHAEAMRAYWRSERAKKRQRKLSCKWQRVEEILKRVEKDFAKLKLRGTAFASQSLHLTLGRRFRDGQRDPNIHDELVAIAATIRKSSAVRKAGSPGRRSSPGGVGADSE